jgi:hypothetical protein
MIIVELGGGLGNQMFQYACGRKLAISNKTELILDTTFLWKDKLRNYNLNMFNIKGKKVWYVGKEMLFLKAKLSGKEFVTINQQGRKFNPKLLKSKGNLYVKGYWQSEKYFNNIRSFLLKDFDIKGKKKAVISRMLKKIKKSNSVCLHVRRGDYVTDKTVRSVHGLCSVDYYKKAINKISSKVKNPVFFVFSDDPLWAEENIKSKYPMHYAGLDERNTEEEDMLLMQNCKHFIIANSSFSWWGAWLSQNKKKIVIAPKKWFVKEDAGDLVPSKWLRV